jgi:hypothetical protein
VISLEETRMTGWMHLDYLPCFVLGYLATKRKGRELFLFPQVRVSLHKQSLQAGRWDGYIVSVFIYLFITY